MNKLSISTFIFLGFCLNICLLIFLPDGSNTVNLIIKLTGVVGLSWLIYFYFQLLGLESDQNLKNNNVAYKSINIDNSAKTQFSDLIELTFTTIKDINIDFEPAIYFIDPDSKDYILKDSTSKHFINQLSTICQKIPGANVDEIAKIIGLDPRIGKLFLNAGPGYGGSCLPKDMKALINFANISGIKPTLLSAVEEVNTKQLEQIISITKQRLGDLTSKRITILGTAFKPNTDDVRDSIAIELIEKLLKRKAKITIHDPRAIKNTRNIFENRIRYAKSVRDALSKSQCVVIMTQWKQYEKLNNNEFKYMTKKIVIDCRRMLVEKQLDVDYFAIGIGK